MILREQKKAETDDLSGRRSNNSKNNLAVVKTLNSMIKMTLQVAVQYFPFKFETVAIGVVFSGSAGFR